MRESRMLMRGVRNARLADGRSVDLRIERGLVVEVAEPSARRLAPDELDARGALALSAAADAHAHLDKALSSPAAGAAGAGVGEAARAFASFQAGQSEAQIRARADRAARRLLANGTTAVRSHVSIVDDADPYRAIRAVAAVRDTLAGALDVQLVALSASWQDTALVEGALDAGADLLGGAPHLSPRPLAETERLVGIAARRGVSLDLHVDEDLAGEPTLGRYAELCAAAGIAAPAASHCVRLGTLGAAERDALVRVVAAAGMRVVTLPATNLYLQGRDDPVRAPRGLPPLGALRRAGVVVGAGGDNVRDPFNPIGRSDPFETAALLVLAGQLAPEEAWRIVTAGSRAVLGLPEAGPREGAVADLLLVPARDVAEAIAEAPAQRTVLRAGRLVARRTVVDELAGARP